MSKYTPLVKKSYPFEGDTVTVLFKRLTRAQMLQLTPFLPDSEDAVMSNEENILLMDETTKCLKDNIAENSGLKDPDGNALDLKDCIDDSYFMGLASLISADMMTESMVNAKKLKKQKEGSIESTKVTKDTTEMLSESQASG